MQSQFQSVLRAFQRANTGSVLSGAIALVLFSAAQSEALTPDYLCHERKTTETWLRHRWLPQAFPLRIYLPAPPGHFQLEDSKMPVQAVIEALRQWQQAWPALSYQFVANPEQAQIQVKWFNGLYHDGQGRWGQAYLPEPIYKQGKLVGHWSEMHLSVRTHPGSALHSPDMVPLHFREIRDLAIHEFGHVLGLPHSNDGGDVMGGNNHFLHTMLDMRTISTRDVATLTRLYRLSPSHPLHCP